MSATLPTCSGVFFRLHCRHQQLFEKEYKRSNRNRGTKILRCFPHCCPSHVERSYCGSSLELAVEFHRTLPMDAHSLFVFARFETVDLETTLAIGEYCSLRYLQSVSQSETNPEATWIQSVPQSRPPSATTRVFLLNGQTSSKWYYHWESGANKARRLTKHLLKAYILYRRPRAANGELSDQLQVIGTVGSPPFTLVSYRRAVLEEMEGMEGAGYPADGDAGDEYDLQQVVQHQISQAFQDFQQQSSSGTRAKQGSTESAAPPQRRRVESYLDRDHQQRDSLHSLDDASLDDDEGKDEREADCGCESCGHYRRARPAPVSTVVQDQWTWERQHTAMALHMKDIAVIYHFIANTPMSIAMQSSFHVREHIYTALQQHWTSENESRVRPRSSGSLQQPALLLSLLFPGRDGAATAVGLAHSLGVSGSSSGAAMNAQVENLLLIVTKLGIWMLSRESIQIFHSFFQAHADVLLHKRSLRDAFLHFAGLVCKRIHLFWSREIKTAAHDGSAPRDSAFKALRTLSEHILALSHSHTRFQAMWPELREILETPGTVLWESFIAQLRETYARTHNQRVHKDRREGPHDLPRNIANFGGTWVLDASSATIDRGSSTPRDHDGLCVSETLLAMVQLQLIHLRVPSKGILLVRSDRSLLPDANPWMQLVCDGHARSTTAFPLGFSSLLGSQLLGGDYSATMDAARSRIEIELLWWPLHIGRSSHGAHAVRTKLALHLPSHATNLEVSLEVQHGTIPRNAGGRERLTRVDLLSPAERVALGAVWEPVWRAHVSFTRSGDLEHM